MIERNVEFNCENFLFDIYKRDIIYFYFYYLLYFYYIIFVISLKLDTLKTSVLIRFDWKNAEFNYEDFLRMDEYEKKKKKKLEMNFSILLFSFECIEYDQFEYRCIFHFGSTIVSIWKKKYIYIYRYLSILEIFFDSSFRT